MTVRHLKPADVPALKAMAARSGYEYPKIDERNLEAILVVVDEEDEPMMAAAAERLVQIYLWCGEFQRPLAKVMAIRLLHEGMAEVLRGRGYNGAEAYLPPTLAKKFGRRLEKLFGWTRNWPSWNKAI